MHVIILLCIVSVIYADQSTGLEKCQRYHDDDGDNNCERFSFQQISQNFTIASVNHSIETKKVVKTDTLKTVDVIENQLMFKETTIQEDGNFLCLALLMCSIRINNNRRD